MLTAALGFRVHSGWACLALITEAHDTPKLIARRRVELADPKIRGSQQPFHAAKPMKLNDAQAFLERCASAAQAMAAASLGDVLASVATEEFRIVGASILLGSGRPTGDLAATLRSHAMIHTAEGHFFRNALQHGCEALGLPVFGIKEKELMRQAPAAIGIPLEELHRRISAMGNSVGPPWRQDEKLSTIAAWLALACSVAQLR